jgi:hypothetical protein
MLVQVLTICVQVLPVQGATGAKGLFDTTGSGGAIFTTFAGCSKSVVWAV